MRNIEETLDCDPFIKAVENYEKSIELGIDLMLQVGGVECMDNFDHKLADEIQKLIERASSSGTKLSPRARRARLKMIWRYFVNKNKGRHSRKRGRRTDGQNAPSKHSRGNQSQEKNQRVGEQGGLASRGTVPPAL